MKVRVLGNSLSTLERLERIYNFENENDDKIYHNSKLILKLYSKVSWRMSNCIREMNEECYLANKNSLFDVVDSLIDVDPRVDKIRIESRLRSIEDSKSILVLIDQALLLLKSYPKDGERYFEILKRSYMDLNKYNENEILEYLNVSRTTFYRDKKKATTLLGIILWGFVIPDVKKQEIEKKNMVEQNRYFFGT